MAEISKKPPLGERDPRVPASLEDGVARFLRALPPGAPPAVELFVRDAFFAGAGVVFDILTRSPETDPALVDDDAGVALLERISTELEAHVAAMMARPAVGRGRPQ